MSYLVYENRVGFPFKLNSVYEFDDLRRAILFSRERAESYEDKGMTVDHFNGHDWIWYATDLEDASDKGILLQIFLKEDVTGGILIPNGDYDAIGT